MSADELRKTAEVLHDTWDHGIVSLARPDPLLPIISAGPFVDELMRGRADRHKPLYRELRDEGLTQPAIELLHEGRDMFELRYTPYRFAQWLNDITWVTPRPISEADVWPQGRPVPTRAAEPFNTYPRMQADWDHLRATQSAEWDALEAAWVAEWAAADAPDAHKVAAALYEGGPA